MLARYQPRARYPVPPSTGKIAYPVSLRDLIDGVEASQFPGRAEAAFLRIAFAAPAGVTTAVVIPMRAGFVSFNLQVSMFADFYSPDIMGYLYIDGRNNTPLGVLGSGPLNVLRPGLEVIRDTMTVVCINSTALPPVDILVTLDVHTIFAEVALYDDIIGPILKQGFRNIQMELGIDAR